MQVIFVYPDINISKFGGGGLGEVSEGIGALSAFLKSKGHRTALVHITEPIDKNSLFQEIEKVKEDNCLFAFSSISHMAHYVGQYSQWLKENYENLIIYGGVHPTLVPEEAVGLSAVDIVCVGEGELPLLELCNCLQNNKEFTDIAGLWIKKDRTVIKNPVRPMIEDLDAFPFPDRRLFDFKRIFSLRLGEARVMLSRGCPFHCTYCSNHSLKRRYPNREKYVRYRSVDKALEYLKLIVSEDGRVKNIIFMDNILFQNRPWFDNFIERYAQEVNLPFICRGRAGLLTEDIAKRLNRAKCRRILFGVESGNEHIRNEVLQRRMSNKQIAEAFSICRANKIKTESFNMVGLPYENNRTVLDTIKLNARVKPDYPQVFVFYPYPETDLFTICKQEKFITDKRFDSYLEGTILNLPTISQAEIIFAFGYFRLLIKLYSLIYRYKFFKPAEKILDQLFCSKYLPRRTLIKLNKIKEQALNNTLAFIREYSPGLFNFLKKAYFQEFKVAGESRAES